MNDMIDIGRRLKYVHHVIWCIFLVSFFFNIEEDQIVSGVSTFGFNIGIY